MTYSGTDSSSMYDLCWYAYGGTVASTVEDMLSSAFRWDPPTALPTMYVQKPMPQVIEPHIGIRLYKPFLGHKFRLGGSKR